MDNPSVLLSLPLEVMEMILLRMTDDAISVISLWETCHEARVEIERSFNGVSGRKKWASWCKNYYDHPMVMSVLASYDYQIDPDDPDSMFTVGTDIDTFMWFNVYKAALGLPTVLEKSFPVVRRLKKLAVQIKMEIYLSKFRSPNSTSPPQKLTGCNGMMSWNILYGNGDGSCSESLTMFMNSTCQRMIPLSVKNIHHVKFLNLPMSGRQSSSNDIGILKVWRLMIVVSSVGVYIFPVQRGIEGVQIHFPHYTFGKYAFYMPPAIDIYKNYMAIWSNPYDLKIYAISMLESHRRVEINLLVRLSSDHLGSLWQKMAKYSPYFFSLTVKPCLKSTDNNGMAMQVHNQFDLTICSPIDIKYQASICNYCLDKQMTFERLPVQHHSDMDEEQFNEALEKAQFHKSTSDYGLFVAYSEDIIFLSRNGILWYITKWSPNDLRNMASSEENQKIIKLQVISSNMLAIVSRTTNETYIFMVEVIFSQVDPVPTAAAECEPVTEKMGLVVRKQGKANFLSGQDQISQIIFDYDRGVPYLWMEVQSSKEISSDLGFEFFRVDFLPVQTGI